MTEAVVEIELLAPRQRLGRALGGFGLWFLAAAAVAFIPIAHFLLVPLCLVAAIVTLVVRLGTKVSIRSGFGSCPDCRAEQQLDIHGSWRLPKDIACVTCHRRLTLQT
jgi:hypothetical protein